MSDFSEEKIKSYAIENDQLYLEILNYGARVHRLYLKNKPEISLVAGLEKISDYLEDPWSLGACLGPFAGRIEVNGQIELHGEQAAFSKQYWQLVEIEHTKYPTIKLTHTYINDQQHEVEVQLSYSLIQGGLHLEYQASASKECVLNLSNHSYFTLDKAPQIDHYLMEIHANEYLPLNEQLLPTGAIDLVAQKDIDFSQQKIKGALLLDTVYLVANENKANLFKKVASIYSPISRIQMDVHTDQEILICFTPSTFAGICLEAQGFPNAPAHPHFRQSTVGPNNIYSQHTSYSFDII